MGMEDARPWTLYRGRLHSMREKRCRYQEPRRTEPVYILGDLDFTSVPILKVIR